jgi:hypothetical protein
MRPIFIALLLTLAAACTSGRQAAQNKLPEFLNLKVYKQQSYPGVESDLWYTMKYRAEFNLRTSNLITFNYIIVNEDSIPIRMLMTGRFLQDNKSLNADADMVALTAERQVKRSDEPGLNELHAPKSRPPILLSYTYNNKNESIAITEIIQEETIAYPAAPPRGDY